MTSDKEILQKLLGLKLEFLGNSPVKYKSYIPQFSKEDQSARDLEIQKLLGKGVITKCKHETSKYISPIFIRKKPDGSCRLILNLKNINEDMSYVHFKMETLSFITHHSRMLFGITGPEGCLLLCTYTPRSHQVSKIHLEKSIV